MNTLYVDLLEKEAETNDPIINVGDLSAIIFLKLAAYFVHLLKEIMSRGLFYSGVFHHRIYNYFYFYHGSYARTSIIVHNLLWITREQKKEN